MNLHKTLKAYNEAKLPEIDQLLLNEAKNIIDKSEERDLNTLSALGMDANIRKYEKKQKELSEASGFDEIYDISVIKKMAVDYGLRFLPSNYYRGTIDPLMPSIVNKFTEKHGIAVDKADPAKISGLYSGSRYHNDGKQFFILAPSESFNLQARPKDPIIFYKINANKYAFIHKWGNDLNNRRWLANLPFRSTVNFVAFIAIVIILFVLPLVYITKDYSILTLLTFLIICIPISIEYEGNEGEWNSIYL